MQEKNSSGPEESKSDISNPNYNPAEDPEVTDNIGKEFDRTMGKMMPYKRLIMIVLSIVLIMLVVFLGFAYGGLKVCNQVGGFLAEGFTCHLNYTSNIPNPTPYYNNPVQLNINNDK